jgi:predicted RNA-binding protein with PIN domain
MALLIDGYNLLHVTDIFAEAGPGTELHRARQALLQFLAASLGDRERSETTIVFDAAGAPPGLSRTESHAGMTVHFAGRHSDADAMIEQLLDECAAPRELVVVSSDHRVQRAARQHGAAYVDSAAWYGDLRSSRRQGGAAESAMKPAESGSPTDVEYWLNEFGDSAADEEDPLNPFPRGYGDDAVEE